VTIEELLQTYSLEELFELNDLTEEEVVEFLVEEGFMKLPDVLPL